VARRTIVRSSTSPLIIKGYAARTGVPIPPAAGPRRSAFLEHEGITLLRRSLQLYGFSLRTVGLGLLPSMHLLPQPGGIHKTVVSADPTAEPRSRQDKWDRLLENEKRWHESVWCIHHPTYDNTAAAESAARSALEGAVAAYNYLEDHPLADIAHQHAHNVAEFVGGRFGCYTKMSDGTYWDECPMTLMHLRLGMSLGYTSRRLCSICHNDIDDCPHLLDHAYQVSIEKNHKNVCSGCGWTNCSHIPGQVLVVSPVAIHDEINLREISFVSRPRDPLARPIGISLNTAKLSAALGRTPIGEELRCFRCLDPCSGFTSNPYLLIGTG
jgi:hypothetical protein